MNNNIFTEGLKLINRYNSISKKPRLYDTDILLYPSEIHMIAVIGTAYSVTNTEIAKRLGITKGGVSQITSKLLDKGMILKTESRNTNEVFISLTEKGKTAYNGHRKLHSRMYEEIASVTNRADSETINAITDLIDAINTELTRMEESEYDV